jgi:hypothetical protein
MKEKGKSFLNNRRVYMGAFTEKDILFVGTEQNA